MELKGLKWANNDHNYVSIVYLFLRHKAKLLFVFEVWMSSWLGIHFYKTSNKITGHLKCPWTWHCISVSSYLTREFITKCHIIVMYSSIVNVKFQRHCQKVLIRIPIVQGSQLWNKASCLRVKLSSRSSSMQDSHAETSSSDQFNMLSKWINMPCVCSCTCLLILEALRYF